VRERLSLQIRVDQRGANADLGQTQPDGDVLWAVAQKERHGVARLESAQQGDASHAVGVRLEIPGRVIRILVDKVHQRVVPPDARQRGVPRLVKKRVPQHIYAHARFHRGGFQEEAEVARFGVQWAEHEVGREGQEGEEEEREERRQAEDQRGGERG